MVGLSQTQMRAVGEFSKGMQRRIGLAQALINDPDLVILDEPTSGLDPIGCREVKDLILALARRGKTVILSSHLLADVEDVCDRVVIYYGGKVQAMGSVEGIAGDTRRDSHHHAGPFPRDHGARAGRSFARTWRRTRSRSTRPRKTSSAISWTWCRTRGRPRRRPPAPCPAPASPLTCAATRKPSRPRTRSSSDWPSRKRPPPPNPHRRPRRRPKRLICNGWPPSPARKHPPAPRRPAASAVPATPAPQSAELAQADEKLATLLGKPKVVI